MFCCEQLAGWIKTPPKINFVWASLGNLLAESLKNWVSEKVSEPVSRKFGTEKSTGIGIENIWYRIKVSVSVSFNIFGTVTHWHLSNILNIFPSRAFKREGQSQCWGQVAKPCLNFTIQFKRSNWQKLHCEEKTILVSLASFFIEAFSWSSHSCTQNISREFSCTAQMWKMPK